jgi:hypothetical protein
MNKITFKCGNCATLNDVSMWVRLNLSATARPQRCRRCGATHGVLRNGDASVISPVTHPLDDGTRRSPWHLPDCRPIRIGLYELRFSHTEPQVFMFQWDGTSFRDTTTGQRIRMDKFLSWRGVWL